jgi:hypothetical protein
MNVFLAVVVRNLTPTELDVNFVGPVLFQLQAVSANHVPLVPYLRMVDLVVAWNVVQVCKLIQIELFVCFAKLVHTQLGMVNVKIVRKVPYQQAMALIVVLSALVGMNRIRTVHNVSLVPLVLSHFKVVFVNPVLAMRCRHLVLVTAYVVAQAPKRILLKIYVLIVFLVLSLQMKVCVNYVLQDLFPVLQAQLLVQSVQQVINQIHLVVQQVVFNVPLGSIHLMVFHVRVVLQEAFPLHLELQSVYHVDVVLKQLALNV